MRKIITRAKLTLLLAIVLAIQIKAQTPTPADGATGVSQATTNVSWTAFGSGTYDVQFNGTDNTYGTSVSSATGIIALTFAHGQTLNYNTTYYWQVRDNSGPGAWNQYSFTTEIATPVITSPTANATGQALNPTITWTFTGGTTGVTFKIQYRTHGSSSWTDGTTGIAGTASSSPLGATLQYNTAYDVRVVASKTGEADKNSAAVKFTTLLDTPALSSPANATTVTSTSPTFSWGMNASYSNVKFELLLDTSSPASTVNNNVTGSLSMSPASALNSGTKYYYKIKATVNDAGADNNGETNTSASEYYFYTQVALTSPANGLTGVAIEPTFTWSDASFESSYTLLISTAGSSQSAFDAAVVRTKNGIAANTTSYTFAESDTSLSNGTTYYWQIVAIDGSNKVKSPIWKFKTWPSMTVTHGWPTNGATVYTTSTTFSWAINTTTGSLKFKPQVVKKTSAPTTAEWAATTITTTTTSLNTTFSLTGGTQYYWRVVVLNSSSQVVAYSTPTTFTTSGGTNVTLYPSWPTGGNTVYSTTPTAYWYLSTYATGLTYQIRYATNNSVDGSGMLNHSSATNYPTSTSSFSSNQYITFPTLTAGTTYYWQVRAYYSTTSSYSNWSSVASFKVNNTNAVVVPTPSYPTGGVTVYTSSPTLYWYLGTNATGLTYEIDYAEQSTGVDGTADVTGVSNLYYQLSGLTPGKTYQWRVRSNNGTTTSSWSSTQTFKVDGGVSGATVVASWPTGNPTVYTTKPTLSWYLNGSSAGLTGYRVKYSTSSQTWSSYSPGSPSATSGQIDVSGVSNTTTTLTVDLTYGQKYYWAVAATDGSSYTSYSQGTFTIVGGSTAGTPILSSPTGGVTVYSTSPTFYWYFNGSTTGIQGYEVKYSKSGFLSDSTTVSSALSSTSTSVSISGLTPGATYSWKVRAFYGGTTYGSYSSVATFTVDPGASPVQPLVGSPNNVKITSVSPTVSWILPAQSKSQLSYEVVYSRKKDFSDSKTIQGFQKPFGEINNLQSGKKYYWKVRSKTPDGKYSDFSVPGEFEIDKTTSAKDESNVIPKKFIVSQNYPNPFNPTTVIEFALPANEFVTLKIYDMLGRTVRTLIRNEVQAGTHKVVWDGMDSNGRKVASGAYIYRITAGKASVTKKMLLMK